MKKITNFFLKYKVAVLVFTLIVFILSILGSLFLIKSNKINSDMMSYLPKDFNSSKGLEFLQENFNINGDATIVVEGEKNDENLRNSVAKIREFEGISSFLWIEDIEDMESLATIAEDYGINIDLTTMQSYLRHKIEPENQNSKYNYVLIIMMDYNPSTNEAYQLLGKIKIELSDRNIASVGMTETSQTVMTDTLEELPFYILFACIGVIIILLLFTSSYFEPIILFITLGISVLINMGTNIFFPSISIISFATSSILQLALTMDYAIFYMHIYKSKRKTLGKYDATIESVPGVASSIIASALTTIGGFAALYFMKFEVGPDLASVLIKGVVLSLVTVLILQPIFVLIFDKLITKSGHKVLKINCRKITKFAVSKRIIILIIVIALIIPVYMGKINLKYSYFEMYKQEEKSSQEQLAYELGNQFILAVPLRTKDGLSHSDFIKEVQADEKVSGVIGAFSTIDISSERMQKLLESPLTSEYFKNSFTSNYFKEVEIGGKKEWYTLYTIGIKGTTEDEQSTDSYENINSIINKYFDSSYQLGMLVGVNDMKKVTPNDFLVVTIVSIAIILIILLWQYKSLKKAILLVLIIEFGIWCNLSISFLLQEKLNFMIYIIISSVQLGCTVDYAILMANRFEKIKWQYTNTSEAAVEAATFSLPAIYFSALIIITACMSMFFVSDNIVLRQLTGMLARGALISTVLVSFLEPGILCFFREKYKAGK